MYKKWILLNLFFILLNSKLQKVFLKKIIKNMVLFVEISNNFIYN